MTTGAFGSQGLCPSECWVERGPSPIPQAPTFGSQVNYLSHNQQAPLEQMGEPVLMDSANGIEDFGLSENLGKEEDMLVFCSGISSLT